MNQSLIKSNLITTIKDRVILIVKDNNSCNKVIQNLLDEYSNNLLYVNNCVNAIEVLKNNSEVDLIIIDLNLLATELLIHVNEIRAFNPLVPILSYVNNELTDDIKLEFFDSINEVIKEPESQMFLESISDLIMAKDRIYDFFDIKHITSLFASNYSLYNSSLNKYFLKYGFIEGCILDKNFLHKLKGASATLGLVKIKIFSIKLENDINNNQLKESLIKSLEITESLWTKYKKIPISKVAFSMEDTTKLYNLIIQNDPSALDFLLDREENFKCIFIEKYNELKDSLLGYDFIKAESLCKNKFGC